MTQTVDLNRLRRMVLDNQNQNQIIPAAQSNKVFVDREGRIIEGNQVAPEQSRQLSEVHQGTFASNRYAFDSATVARKFPANAYPASLDGVLGFQYSIVTEYRDHYDLFIYHDGSLYQVVVVFPEIAGQYDVHDAHLYSSGVICLSTIGGLPILEQAYAKSVLWTNGFSIFLRTGKFPFSRNN